MPIPDFDHIGLLPGGVHACTLAEVRERFGWNADRIALLDDLERCLTNEVRPQFPDPVVLDGSFVTDKPDPLDTDIVLDLTGAPIERLAQALLFMMHNQERLMDEYKVHFWIDFPGAPKHLSVFFQYVGVKTAQAKGLAPTHLKGILRLI
jgi:hypothetical protein